MKKLVCCILFLSLSWAIQAQDINPFESIGKKGKILTLSKGKYTEVHLYDSLQRIGSVIINMNTGEIQQLLDIDTLYSEATLDPTVVSRHYSPDPLQAKYPYWSPYLSFGNNPVIYRDPDGREIVIGTIVYTPGMAVPNDADIFTRNAIEGLNYLHNNTDEVTKGKIDLLVNTGGIRFRVQQAGTTRYNPQGFKILYNDQQAAEYTNGNVRPNVVGYGHELDHAYMHALLFSAFSAANDNLMNRLKSGEITKEQYNSLYMQEVNPLYEKFVSYEQEHSAAEEQRATEGIEAAASKSLCVQPRAQYGLPVAKYFVPKNIYSTEPKTTEAPAGEGQEIQLQNNSKSGYTFY